MTRLTVTGLVLLAGAALAQDTRPTLVPFPLDLQANPALTRFRDRLKADYAEQLRLKGGAVIPVAREVDRAMVETRRQDCRESNECLAQLATKAGTLYALYAELTYSQKKQLTLSGRVVRDDGKLMGTGTVSLPKGGDTIVDIARVLAGKLFAELKLAELPTFKEAPPVVVTREPDPTFVSPGLPSEPPPPPPPLEPAVEVRRVVKANPLRAVGIGVGAGGAAVLVGGVVTFATAPVVDRDGDGNLVSVEGFRGTLTQQSVGVGMMIGGAVVAAGGAVMAILARDREVQAMMAPLPGGGAVVVGGRF